MLRSAPSLCRSISKTLSNTLVGRILSPMSTPTTRFRSTQPAAADMPRPSASLVVVNARNEVLLVRRNHNATAFGGMHVFPGGNFDQKQDNSLEMTAIRETFEESGLLLASPTSSPLGPLTHVASDEARQTIHQQKLDFNTFLQKNVLRANVDLLLPFTRWVTPVGPPRRFKTQFYITFLPAVPSSDFSSGSKQEYLPTHDHGQEIIEARFIHPRKALEECGEGRLICMPPQFYILSTLADILDGAINTAEQRGKLQALSAGAFGKFVFNPRKIGWDEDGRLILALEGDETSGIRKGRLHRVIAKMHTGIPTRFALVRNFDIFNELEIQDLLNNSSAKL